jgi:hypothetical protein
MVSNVVLTPDRLLRAQLLQSYTWPSKGIATHPLEPIPLSSRHHEPRMQIEAVRSRVPRSWYRELAILARFAQAAKAGAAIGPGARRCPSWKPPRALTPPARPPPGRPPRNHVVALPKSRMTYWVPDETRCRTARLMHLGGAPTADACRAGVGRSTTGSAQSRIDRRMVSATVSASRHSEADLRRNLEAPPGFEPGMEVVQSSNRPIRDVTISSNIHNCNNLQAYEKLRTIGAALLDDVAIRGPRE